MREHEIKILKKTVFKIGYTLPFTAFRIQLSLQKTNTVIGQKESHNSFQPITEIVYCKFNQKSKGTIEYIIHIAILLDTHSHWINHAHYHILVTCLKGLPHSPGINAWSWCIFVLANKVIERELFNCCDRSKGTAAFHVQGNLFQLCAPRENWSYTGPKLYTSVNLSHKYQSCVSLAPVKCTVLATFDFHFFSSVLFWQKNGLTAFNCVIKKSSS